MSIEKQIKEMARITEEHCELDNGCGSCSWTTCNECLAEVLYNAGYRKIPENIGDFSDGYHTFNELYHHRAVLFSVICNMFPEKAWKSKLHDTGDMFDGMFIVGIETEQGQATYHYDIEPYWDMFKVKELEKAPKWDGHTPSEAIQRIGGISSKQSENTVELPCKIGDTVYRVKKRRGVWCVLPREVVSITYRLDHLHNVVWEIFSTETDVLGKSVFLTEEEAEAALAKMKGGAE